MRRPRAGDKVRSKSVDDEERLGGLTPGGVGTVDMELAVGGFLVGFLGEGLGVFAEERLEVMEPSE